MAATKELFVGTKHSELYDRFRPPPPDSIIQNILNFLAEANGEGPWELAVDVGCGTGAATRLLSPHFSRVLGLDISMTQVEQAAALPNLTFQVSGAEKLPVQDGSVDLLSAFVALHWFDLDKFWEEVKRVLKPNGVMVAFAYWDSNVACEMPGVSKNICQEARGEFLKAIQGFWNPRAHLAKNLYKDIEFPYTEVRRLYSQEAITFSLEDYAGYLESFSPFQQLSKNNPKAATEVLDKFVYSVLKETELEDPRKVKLSAQRDFVIVLCRGPK